MNPTTLTGPINTPEPSHTGAHAGAPLLQMQGGRATIVLNRPAHHNRLHMDDLLVLQQHFTTLQSDPHVRVLVLTATGRSFCSGFHLAEFDRQPAEPGAGPRLFEQTVDALEALSVPSICRFNGSVYGGATDLALACDFRIGVQGMTLRMPAARLGLHYYPNGLRRAVSRLGLAAAKRLFLLANSVPAEALLALGYLDQLVPVGELDAAVQTMADALTAGAPLALRGMKQSLDEIARGDFHVSTLRAREARCVASEDLQEGRAAMAEKRPPRFVGR